MVAVTRIARDILAQPIRLPEIFRGLLVVEFHFGHDEPFMAIVINIDFNDEIAEGNLVACFHEPFASGGRPKRIELTRQFIQRAADAKKNAQQPGSLQDGEVDPVQLYLDSLREELDESRVLERELTELFDHERVAAPGVDHVFVVLKGPNRGRPLSAAGVDEVLAGARRRAGGWCSSRMRPLISTTPPTWTR